MKKILALILTLLMILPMIVACQNATTEDPKVTTAAPKETDPAETEDPFKTGVPKTDYQEHEFIIAAPAPWGDSYFDREEMTDDTVNDAIYTRNRALEDYFNIVITSQNIGMTHEQATAFKTFAITGEDIIDLIAVATYQSGKPMITEGMIKPWNDVKHINLDKSWWNKPITETLSVLGNYYYLSGDINFNYMNNIMCTYFNKEVAERYSTVTGDIYQTVRDSKWTWDTFNNIVKQVTSDNGDGVWDATDTYGHLQYYHALEAWTYGANYQTVIMEENGARMNIYTTRMKEIIDQVYDMIFTNHWAYLGGRDGIQTEMDTMFFDNRALFYTTNLGNAHYYRQYDTDFGIIPNPKYDEKQKNYWTYSDQWGLVMSLPFTATDTDRTGAILEEMCALSKKLIRVAVYDKSLIGRGIRDDESEEMLDILFSYVLYDLGITFCTDLANIPLRSLIDLRSNGIASWWRRKQKVIENNFNELFDYVKEQNELGHT